MADKQKDRLVKIIELAHKLNWIFPPIQGQSYPTMMLSEVEKCMLAMVDDNEFERMNKYIKDANQYPRDRLLSGDENWIKS